MNLKNSRVVNSLIIFLLLFSVCEGIVLTVCAPEQVGLQGAYYDNTEWKGEPAATSLDTEFSTVTLKAVRQQLGKNEFSVEWDGFLYIAESGDYSFSTNSDDGSQLLIDGGIVVNNGGAHGLQEKQSKVHLLQGLHRITVKYNQIGGFAVLDVLWAQDPLPRAPLHTALLLPPKTSVTQFWIYRQAQALFLYIALLWTLVIAWLGFSTSRKLRISQKGDFTRHLRGTFTFWMWCEGVVTRLLVQPLEFAGEQIVRQKVYHWTAVTLYSSVIFLTLSYARVFSKFMLGRFGDDVFSNITTVTLTSAGALLLVYLVSLRTQLLSRLLSFIVIVAVYGFFLSPELRESVYTLLHWVGVHTQFWESLDLYPIYAGEKVHFLEYGALGLLLCKTLRYHHIKDKTAYFLALAIVYLIGMTDEGLQWALPTRVGEYRDIWMNITSGGLAILAVALVVRPKAFQENFHWSSLRPLLYTLAVGIVYTGLFLQLVHGFGSRIFMPDSGTEFVSAFSEYELLELDKHLLQRAEGVYVEDIPTSQSKIYTYEAGRHHYLRNKFHEKEQEFESYAEQEILKAYFRGFVQRQGLELFEYEPDEFTVTPDPDAYIFFRSPGQELSIVAFTQTTMWTYVGLSAVMLCLLATWLPVSEQTRSRRFRMPGQSRQVTQRFERVVLRPVFGVLLAFVIGTRIYLAASVPVLSHTNVVILTVDSCQPDYWSAYGYEKNTTPAFDELMKEGVLFSNMIVPASWTIPSLTSMLTGVNPNVHGINARGDIMDARVPTLFEALEGHGYAIGDTSYTLTEPSINSVFKKKDISPDVALSEGKSEESYLLTWMEDHKEQPFFGWVHFHTSHLPYRATPPYNKLFLDGVDPEVLHDKEMQLVKSNLIIRKGEVEFDKERHEKAVHALYAQTLRQQDAKIRKVIMKLDELGLRENTLIVITADHGDELLEHGFIGHASTSWDTTTYDDLIQVPLGIFYPKKLPQGKRIEAQVRQIDLMPTILDALDIPFDAPLQGKSYLGLMQGTEEFEVTAFSETTPCGYSCPKRLENNRLKSVRTNDWKFISVYDDDSKDTSYELYHLAEDPGETTNVLDEYPEIAAQYKAEMQRWIDAPQQFAYQPEKAEGGHYLDTDVEVRPIIQFPKVGTVLSPKTYQNRVLVQWIGQEEMEYVIEYEVGTGGYHMSGDIPVVGTEQWFGPFPADIWQALPLYNPWKFRVIPKNYPQYPSEWITFEMKYE